MWITESWTLSALAAPPVSEQQLSGGRVQRERTRREEEEVLTVGRGGGGLSRDAVGATRRAKGGVYRRGERVLDVHTARRAEANTSGCRLNVAPMHQRCRLVAPWRPHPIAVVVSPSYLPPTHPPLQIYLKKRKKSVLCVRPATLCVSAGGKKKKNGRPSCLFGWVGNKIRRRRLNPLTTASVGVRGRHFAQLVASPCVMTTQRVLTCIVTLNSSFLSIWLFSRKRPRTKFQKKNKKKLESFVRRGGASVTGARSRVWPSEPTANMTRTACDVWRRRRAPQTPLRNTQHTP